MIATYSKSTHIETKVLHFEYILFSLLNWYEEKRPRYTNDFSVLKSLKLLFFVVAADTKNNYHLLDNIFSSFYAMPFGHVETEIYDYIKDKGGDLTFYRINNRTAEEKKSLSIADWTQQGHLDLYSIREIDESISFIKSINPNLVFLTAYELVDLSHAWYSWKNYFSKAEKQHSKSCFIPVEDIKKENKIFAITAL